MSYIIAKNVGGYGILCQVRDEKRGNRIVQVFEKDLGSLGIWDKDKVQELGIPIVDSQSKTLVTRGQLKANPNAIMPPCWNKLRADIYIRDKGICWICKEAVLPNEYELGHLIDRGNGGLDDYDNLAVMHKNCNQHKPKHKTMDEHIMWLLKTRFLADKASHKRRLPTPTQG